MNEQTRTADECRKDVRDMLRRRDPVYARVLETALTQLTAELAEERVSTPV